MLYCAVVAECPLACVQAAQPHGRLERLLRVSSERKRLPGEKIAEEEYFIPSMPWSKCACGSLRKVVRIQEYLSLQFRQFKVYRQNTTRVLNLLNLRICTVHV